MNYTWTIEQLERMVDTGGVVTAHWRAVAEEDGFTESVYGSVSFNPEPNTPGFIPYESLTEQEVLSWVWSWIDRVEIEARLSAGVLEKKQPVVVAGLPW